MIECTYSKDELIEIAARHQSTEVRRAAAEALYSRGVVDGGREIIEARQRVLGSPAPVSA